MTRPIPSLARKTSSTFTVRATSSAGSGADASVTDRHRRGLTAATPRAHGHEG
ncbi:MAG TPA: hypothetical protein VER39_15900 [Nocardioidaceae bacterium]|nr:hypothetical protein [Nocardioidaceae bacterium]